ncbi:hypothetical protein MMC17_007214 [Xylographa soralifera]|nr:hypothetical protein [Xylographa soralifera]
MSTFALNCSIPPDVVNYVSSANARGTLDIVWSCLSVLVLCTWTVQHLNVPPQIRPHTEAQKWRLRLHWFFWKLKWMVLTVIAPECLLGKALIDMLSASHSCDVMRAFAEKDKIEWTITHAYFANIGGFGLLFDESVTKNTTFVGEHRSDCAVGNCREHMNESTVAKCGNTIIPGTANGYLESMSPLYRNARLLAQQSFASMLPSSQIENGSTTPANEQVGPTHAMVKVPSASAGTMKNVQEPQAQRSRPEMAISEASVDPELLNITPPQSRREVSYRFNRDSIPVDDFRRELSSPFGHCGDEDWIPNDINRRLVARGMQKLAMQGQSILLRSRQRNLMSLQGSIWILDAAQLRLAREQGILAQLPHIHEQVLDDQNKGDALVKVLAVIQVLWLNLTLIVRAARHLPSSQLELLVAAFTGCSFVIYVLFWNKPKDISTTRYITAARYPTEKEILDIALEGPSTFFHYREGYWIPNNAVHRMSTKSTFGVASNETSENDRLDRQPRRIFLIGSAIGAVIFGAPHLAAWYFTFPTSVERVLWRVAALMTVIAPLIGALFNTTYSQLYQRSGRHRAKAREPPGSFQIRYLNKVSYMIWFFALPYLVARLYIIVEVFRCLCYLPPEAFVTTWAANIPHLN